MLLASHGLSAVAPAPTMYSYTMLKFFYSGVEPAKICPAGVLAILSWQVVLMNGPLYQGNTVECAC